MEDRNARSTCEYPERTRLARDYAAGVLGEGEALTFEDHLVGCPDCAARVLALDERLLQLEGELALRRPAGRALWGLLSTTLLRPAPALAYFVALLALGTWLLVRSPDPAPGGESGAPARWIAPAVRVFGEDPQRGAAPAPALPLELDAPAARGPLLLELRTEIDDDLLADPQAIFVLALRDRERLVLERELRGGDFGERRSLYLLLDSRELSPGATYTLTVMLERPGHRLHGEALFRRALRYGG